MLKTWLKSSHWLSVACRRGIPVAPETGPSSCTGTVPIYHIPINPRKSELDSSKSQDLPSVTNSRRRILQTRSRRQFPQAGTSNSNGAVKIPEATVRAWKRRDAERKGRVVERRPRHTRRRARSMSSVQEEVDNHSSQVVKGKHGSFRSVPQPRVRHARLKSRKN